MRCECSNQSHTPVLPRMPHSGFATLAGAGGSGSGAPASLVARRTLRVPRQPLHKQLLSARKEALVSRIPTVYLLGAVGQPRVAAPAQRVPGWLCLAPRHTPATTSRSWCCSRAGKEGSGSKLLPAIQILSRLQ